MAIDRATLNETTQLGLETTPGTVVPANKLMSSLTILPTPELDIKLFGPANQKFNAVSIVNKESGMADLEGILDYNEVVFPLSSVMTQVTPTGGPAYTWVFGMSNNEPDDPATFTIEQGNAVSGHASRAGYGLVTEFTINVSRDDTSVGGSMMTQDQEPDIVMTASPDTIPLKPVMPRHWDVYIDDTFGGLGGTQMDRVFEFTLTIGDRFNPIWPLKSSEGSYAGHVETKPTVTAELRMEADDEGLAMITALKAGDRKYIRLVGTSGTDYITGTTPYSITIDMAGVVSDVGDLEDMDGVYGQTITLTAVFESGWGSGKAIEITVVNAIDALT